MSVLSALLWLAASYLVGATPTSYVAGRLAKGIDLREHGSRNLGATNVYRVLGWRWAIPVALIDIAKGALPVALFGAWAHGAPGFPVFLGLAAVLGHIFSPYVGFKGGKGVATAAGMFLALAPLAVLIALPVWGLCLWATGYVSLSSILAAVIFPVLVLLTTHGSAPPLIASAGLALLIVYSHRANIRRLFAGTENRFRTRKELSP
ncbi:MAG TPA: glycerol-3-phosphate 1-O-acyltransferase PlsY [Gemmatimonadales bacterium]|nr:glycerol-3-phosphate 1-O-acyltransferase PlsY [Gemmatimonadales bacterium]